MEEEKGRVTFKVKFCSGVDALIKRMGGGGGGRGRRKGEGEGRGKDEDGGREGQGDL